MIRCDRRVRYAALGVLLGSLALGPRSDLVASAAAPDEIVVNADAARVRLQSPYLSLEVNLRNPSLDVLRVAPAGDRRYGANIGVLVEEATVDGRRLRSSSDDPDGARASWQSRASNVQLQVEGIDIGSGIGSTWTITVPGNSASLQLDRTSTLRGSPAVESIALAMVSPSVPENTDPASLAFVLNGATYRNEVGPATLERPGGTLGLLAVDNPELSYSARSTQAERAVARYEGAVTTLALTRKVTPKPGLVLQDSGFLRFGWQNDFTAARSDLSPNVESRLLASGYYGNAVVAPVLGPVLSASMRDYRGSVWSRDLDYALQGYGYVLSDMSVFRNALQQFLDRIDSAGVAPESILLNGYAVNRESWDSMVNVVEATHTYVAKTGDLDFYRRNQAGVTRAMNWVKALDADGDGLPDRDIFPYGYTDTVENGPMHTYAIAKFYAGYLAFASLEDATGRNGESWREYARRTKLNFARPLSAGGYWNPEAGYPIAWKRANGEVFTTFETFGVFEAIRSGLLSDPDQLRSVGAWLDANRDAFLNGNPYPERLMIGGYDPKTRKAEVPLDKLWIMDCNAPWITGISVPARVRLGRMSDARAMLDVYAASSYRRTPHAEFGAGPLGRFGPGETQDGGRLWDNWSWFSAVYGTHFGLTMTIPALEIAPAPLYADVGNYVVGVNYQGADVQLKLYQDGYEVTLSAAKRLVLKPPYGFSWVDLNGDRALAAQREVLAQPGVPYLIRGYR